MISLIIPFLIFVVLIFIATKIAYIGLKPYKIGFDYTMFTIECFVFVSYLFTFLPFYFGLTTFHSEPYNVAIDPSEMGYTPFSFNHILSLSVFYVINLISSFIIWLKGRELTPLIVVLCSIFIIFGLIINTSMLMQFIMIEKEPPLLICLMPLLGLFISILLIIKLIRERAEYSMDKSYSNKYLNWLNSKLSNVNKQPLWILVLAFPIFLIITLILILFGQQYDSMVKVFTETTTWHFSTETHPPFLEAEGHYLCTVAACGSPDLVRPLFIGKRHGHEIIVNRQLQIANAFEELIQDHFPSFHKLIRKFYDDYGYPFSKHILKRRASNTTYVLMKPFEYIFLIVLYLGCNNPKHKIHKQYRTN